jgi:hypothetical protein
MPLTNADLEEEKEVELYTIPFVDNLDNPVGSPVKRTPIKRKQSVMEAPQPVDQFQNHFTLIGMDSFNPTSALILTIQH